jgi:DNA-binding LacI/PurR family transcriptional regulator
MVYSNTFKLETIGSRGTLTLAQAMGRDIAQQFQTGDRFFTVREVARRYGVSLLTAHRGMQELAKRQILELHPGSGTFIGPGARRNCVKVVQLIVTPETAGIPLLLEGLIQGLFKALPGFSIQVNLEPQESREEYFQELLHLNPGDGREVAGVVLSGVSHEARFFFSKQQIPAVVTGHTEENVELPYVDFPQREMGKRTGEFLMDRGVTRLAVLPSEYWLPGDAQFLSGFQEALAGRSIAANGFTVQPLSHDSGLARQELIRMLQVASRPSALICRRPWMSQQCLEAVRELGLEVPGDILILSTAPSAALISQGLPFFIGFACDFEVLGRATGELLSKLLNGQCDRSTRVELPIELTVCGIPNPGRER